jgi:glutamate/tyrosine decarboxylase-like PLP-dependent enzyme
VLDHLVKGADAGLVGTAGPRYFGFVTGGSLPAALAAESLAVAWDRNGFMFVASPAAAAADEVAGRWASDPLAVICDSSRRRGAWVHVDGAFGLWAAAGPAPRPLLDGSTTERDVDRSVEAILPIAAGIG